MWNTELSKQFLKDKLKIKAKATISNKGFMPSIGFESTQLAPVACKNLFHSYIS